MKENIVFKNENPRKIYHFDYEEMDARNEKDLIENLQKKIAKE